MASPGESEQTLARETPVGSRRPVTGPGRRGRERWHGHDRWRPCNPHLSSPDETFLVAVPMPNCRFPSMGVPSPHPTQGIFFSSFRAVQSQPHNDDDEDDYPRLYGPQLAVSQPTQHFAPATHAAASGPEMLCSWHRFSPPFQRPRATAPQQRQRRQRQRQRQREHDTARADCFAILPASTRGRPARSWCPARRRPPSASRSPRLAPSTRKAATPAHDEASVGTQAASERASEEGSGDDTDSLADVYPKPCDSWYRGIVGDRR